MSIKAILIVFYVIFWLQSQSRHHQPHINKSLGFFSFRHDRQHTVRNSDDTEIDEVEHNGADADCARCAR